MESQGNEYDVIVLGSGFGGLVAGSFLAKWNRSVLLLKEKGYQPFHVNRGFRFVPFSNFSEKRLRPSLLRKVSQALNLPLMVAPQDKGNRVQKQKVSFQVILPRARVDLFSQRSLSQMEWRREFPKEVAQIENFYDEMDHLRQLLKKVETKEGPQSFFPLRPRSLIKRLLSFRFFLMGGIDERLSPFSREFRQFIQLQLISQGNLYSDRFPTALAAHLLLNDEPDDKSEELVSIVNMEKLNEDVLRHFLQTGGKIEEIERVGKVETKWGKGFILSLEEDQRVFQSKVLILNSPLHRLSNLLSKKEKRLSKVGMKIQPWYILLPLFFGIREKVVPVGMEDLLVSILDLEKPYEGGNLLFLSLSPRGDETQAPERRRALTVESLIPFGKRDPDSVMDHRKDVMRHLHWLFPFLEDHIEFTDWSWTDEQISCWSYPHFFYETGSGFHWREGVVPTRISRNLYLVGKENFPYLGLEGEALSGLMVGQQILQKLS